MQPEWKLPCITGLDTTRFYPDIHFPTLFNAEDGKCQPDEVAEKASSIEQATESESEIQKLCCKSTKSLLHLIEVM